MSYSSEIVETAVELEPLTQPTRSQNNFLAKRLFSADVQQTVHRGAELREQKARNVLTSGKQQKLRLISAKARGPCDPPKCKSNRQVTSNKSLLTSRSSGLCPSIIFLQSSTSIKRSRSRSQSRKKCDDRNGGGSVRDKCPLRIAELAEPTKRHCLNTWRNMPDTLPDHMLDRLQQRIMDQKPVVQLDEAINFFQIRGRIKRMSPKQRRQCREEATNQEIKFLCAIFARNMAKKLMKPINISNVIATEMINLVNVVSSEISKVLKNRQICTIEFTSDNDTIQLEMAAKIAMWIESILKDTGVRMLESELRAKIDKERRMGKEGHITTLIEKYFYYDYRERDLEEEEGPVLDFIDELFENVMVESSPVSAMNTENELEDEADFENGDDDKVTDEHTENELENGAEFGDGGDDNVTGEHIENELEDGGDDKVTDEYTENELEDGGEFGDGVEHKVTDEHSSGGAKDKDIESFSVNDNKTDEIYYDSNDIEENVANSNNEYYKDADNKVDVDTKDTDEEKDILQSEDPNNLDDNKQTEKHINSLHVSDVFQPENAFTLEENQQTGKQIKPLKVNDVFQPEKAFTLEDNQQTEKEINPLKVNDVFQAEKAFTLEDNHQTEQQIKPLKVSDVFQPEKAFTLEDNQQTEKQINPQQVNDVFPLGNANKLEDNEQTEQQGNSVKDMQGKLDVEQVGINANIEEPSGIHNLNDEQQPQISVTTGLNEDKGNETYKDDRKVKFTSLDPESGELGENSVRPANIEDKTSDSWNIPSDIIFAPPNHGLLSDADESWPDKHAHGIGFKFSESVSKSVTSLGHIQENDERFNENAELDEESIQENLRTSEFFTEPEYGERPDYDIITKSSETTMETERENLVISTNIHSNITDIVSDIKLIRNQHSEDESVQTKLEIPQIKVEIKKKVSSVQKNDVTEIQFDENYTKTQSRISSVQEKADNAFLTTSLNFEKDSIFVIDDGKGDTRVNENESISLTNMNNCLEAASNKNTIYQVPASSRNVFHRCDNSLSSSKHRIKIEQCEAQRWCSDLERTVDNLCHWYKWIDDVCNKMMTLQQKSVHPRADVKILEIFKEWVDLQSDIDNDAVLWNKLRQQTKIALQTYKKNAKPTGVPNYRKSGRDAIFDMCLDIDGLTMWIDSLMTTTEYCMKCKCKYYSKKS